MYHSEMACLAVSMPTTPKGHKRPADVVSNAVHVMKVATGEIEELTEDGKNAAAVALGRKGGLARAKNISGKRLFSAPQRLPVVALSAPLVGDWCLHAVDNDDGGRRARRVELESELVVERRHQRRTVGLRNVRGGCRNIGAHPLGQRQHHL